MDEQKEFKVYHAVGHTVKARNREEAIERSSNLVRRKVDDDSANTFLDYQGQTDIERTDSG